MLALRGVSVPVFSARGLGMKRSSGEIITPYYFAYEDLKEDWAKLKARTDGFSAPTEPKVSVRDLSGVMTKFYRITT